MINEVIKKLALGFAAILWVSIAMAQTPLPGEVEEDLSTDACSQVLRDAREAYNDGRWEGIPDSLANCQEFLQNRNEQIELSFYQLAAKAHIQLQQYDKAAEQVQKLMILDPSFQPDSEDPQVFISLVDSFRVAEKIAGIEPEIRTATKTKQPLTDAPATVYVYTREQIQTRGYTSLIELLADVPEIQIQHNAVAEFKNVIGLRGIIGNEKFIIMLDGVRITATTGDPHAVAESYSLVNAAQVEIVIGPASALYGVDAFSGIINIISVDGEEIVKKGEKFGGRVTTSFGRFSNTDNSFLLAYQPRKDITATFSASFYHSEEPKYADFYPDSYTWFTDSYLPLGIVTDAFQTDTTTITDFSRDFEMPTSSYFLNTKLYLGSFEVGGTRHFERHSSAISVDPQYTLYTRTAYFASTIDDIYGRHYFRPQNKDWMITSNVSYGSFKTDPRSKFLNSFTGFAKGFKYQFSSSFKIEEQFDWAITDSISLIAGASFENLTALPKTGDLPAIFDEDVAADEQNLYYLGTDISNADGDTLVVLQDFFYLNYRNYGSYAQMLFKVSKKAEITIGGRFDHNTRFGSSVNPRAGLLYRASDNMKLKLLYGESFLAPSPWKAYAHFGSFSTDTATGGDITGLSSAFLHLPNSRLQPEKLRTIEASATYVNRRMIVAVNGFYNALYQLIDLAVQDVNRTSFHNVPVSYVEIADNAGNAQTYGATIHGRLQLKEPTYPETPEGVGGDPRPVREQTGAGINVYGSYSFTGGKENGDQLPLTAAHTIKTGVDWKYRQWSASLRYNFRGRQFSKESPGVFLEIPSFGVTNLHVRYALARTKGWWDGSFFLKVNNLLDNRYYHGAYEAGTTTLVNRLIPQDPIRYNIGVQMKF